MDAKRAPNRDTLNTPTSLDGFSLPGWIYHDADFLEAEKERIFATSWQVMCHLSDIPKAGDYHTLDFLGEPLVAVRGQDGRQGILQCVPPSRCAPVGRRLGPLCRTHRLPVPCLDLRS